MEHIDIDIDNLPPPPPPPLLRRTHADRITTLAFQIPQSIQQLLDARLDNNQRDRLTQISYMTLN
jgi:hypothetical protein